MSHKDYVMLAEAIARMPLGEKTKQMVASRLARAIEEHNPNFKANVFIAWAMREPKEK